MLDGKSLKLGDKEYIVPPLNLKAIRKLLPQVNAIQTGRLPTVEDLAIIGEVVHAALVRNYPELTLDAVEDMLDITNMHDAMSVVLGASGLAPKPMAVSPEALANLAGVVSTGSSLPQQDGPTTT